MSSQLRDTVPVPRRILDEHMPELNDTSLRVILAVTRQTLGWRTATGERKSREWITHSWLQKMTGRSGASVSAAVESLSRQGLIVVTDVKGRPLDSKAERRSHRGKLYYGLAEFGHEKVPSRVPWDRQNVEVENVGTIKKKYIKDGQQPDRRPVRYAQGPSSWQRPLA